MSTTARTIRVFRDRAESLRIAYTTTPIWGLDAHAEQYWQTEGVCYRLKDAESDAWLSGRYRAAADWLEERASGETLAALHLSLTIR